MARPSLEALKALQEIDTEIRDLSDDIAAFPRRRAEREASLRKNVEAEAGIRKELTKVKVLHREKESELRAAEEEIRRLQKVLSEVKTNKEYTSVQSEIASQRQKISDIEDEILLILERVDELESREKEAMRLLEEERRRTEEENAADETRVAEAREVLARKMEERQRRAAAVDQTLLTLYERIRKSKKDGIAVCQMVSDDHGGRCGGCFVVVPTDVAQKVRQFQTVQCENCGRILLL